MFPGSCCSIFSFLCNYCRPLFVYLSFVLLPLLCLFFFDLRPLITSLVSKSFYFRSDSYLLYFSNFPRLRIVKGTKQIFKIGNQNSVCYWLTTRLLLPVTWLTHLDRNLVWCAGYWCIKMTQMTCRIYNTKYVLYSVLLSVSIKVLKFLFCSNIYFYFLL